MTLRQKLALCFGGLLLVIGAMGVHSILRFRDLGQATDTVLRENYESIVACREMDAALSRLDRGSFLLSLGRSREGEPILSTAEGDFGKGLRRELEIVTLPGEGKAASRIEDLFRQYRESLSVLRAASSPDSRRRAYEGGLLPLVPRIHGAVEEIHRMNEANMFAMDRRARLLAGAAQRQVFLTLLATTALSALFLYLAGRWILLPITRLTRSAEEIGRGNLDLVLRADSADEVGRLTETFNAMAASLREFRRTDESKLHRIRRATRQAFDSLPEAIAVLDADGVVEVSTAAARNAFGLKTSVLLNDLPLPWLRDLFARALLDGRPASLDKGSPIVQHFLGGEERFYRPEAIPILDPAKGATGVVLVLTDVTRQRLQDEMKHGVISTVSHQLKTPLTSVRMALHLLLEEKVGGLTEKQAELLVAAREEADRLDRILGELLDIGRIGSGRVAMELKPVSPAILTAEGVEPHRSAARDGGVSLAFNVPDSLPEVWVDRAQLSHVFANLVLNALKYTSPGGRVAVTAAATDGFVRFRVTDTGVGIPVRYLPHVLDPFFRVPEQRAGTGAGLGLAIVKEIVEAHGGTVEVESREGEGSAFSFTLRRVDRFAREGGTA